MSILKAKALSAVSWDFFGKLARNLTGFIVTIFLARLLEPSDFGLIAMIMVIIGIAFIFSDVGLGSALIQRRRLLPIHYNSVFYFNIFIGMTLTVLTFFSATAISQFYDNEKLVLITQVMSILFLINAFSSTQNSKLRRELNYAALAKANVSASVLSGIVGIVLAFNDAGVWSLVAQALSRGIFYNVSVWYASQWVPSMSFSLKALKQLWGFGFRMFLSGLLEVVFTQLDVLIIGKLFSPAMLGFYDQAKRLNAMIIQYSSGSIMAVLFPVLSKVQTDLSRFQNIVIKTLGLISFIVFLLLGVMYLISEELIVLMFTEKWLPSVDYFKILVLSGFAYPVSALLVNILSSRGNSKAFLRLEIYKKILQSINFYVGFLWGIEGFLYGLVVVSIFGLSLNILFASKEIKLSFLTFTKPILIQMIISIMTVLLVMLIVGGIEMHNILLIIIKSSIFVIIYFGLNILFRTSSYTFVLEQALPVIKRKLK